VGTYVSVRGWLEFDEQQLALVKEVVAAHDDGFYSGGWGFPTRHFNWTHYAFYGGDVRESAVEWLLGQVREIAALPASDEDNDLVRGFFVASHELDGSSEWQVRDGQVLVAPAGERYQYLQQ